MRLSVSLTNYSWREIPLVDGLVRAAVTADQGGLDTVRVPDHLAQVDPTVPAEAADMLEAYNSAVRIDLVESRCRYEGETSR